MSNNQRKRRSNKLSTTVERTIELPTYTLRDAIDKFIDERRVMNLSPHTIQYYENELRMFERYMEGHRTDVNAIIGDHIKTNVIRHMQDEGRKETAINARLRAIRALFNYTSTHGITAENPTENISLLRQKKNQIESFSGAQMKALLSAPKRTEFTGLRDYAIMLLMLDTGIRLSELCGIKVNDVNMSEGYVRIVNPKNYAERNLPLTDDVKRAIRMYTVERGDLDHDYLFTNIDDRPLQRRGVQAFIRRYGQSAGITGVRCSPHTFRHTFAKMSLLNGANLFELQYLLGHQSLEMVRVYVNLFSPEVARGHKKFSPVTSLLK